MNNEFNTVSINDSKVNIDLNDYANVCDNLRKRVIRILYLREDVLNNLIKEEDLLNYIYSMIWDLYGAYVVFGNYKFLNCICELEGIKENIDMIFARKKILDLANFIGNICDLRER